MAKTAKSHKNQHYVPQCYTKAWHAPTSDAGSLHTPYVWVFDWDGSNARRRAQKNIFTENDMYTIVCPNGQRDLRLEHGFQELEDRFTWIRNLKFNRRVWPNSEELVWILSFIATAKVRTAAYRDFQRQQWGDIRRRMEELQSEIDKASPELQKTLVGTAGVSLRSGKGIELDEVQRLEARPIQEMIGSTLRTVIPALGKMHVGVLCTDDPLSEDARDLCGSSLSRISRP